MQTVTLTGTYQLPDGTPAKGTIEIIPSEKQIINDVGDVILSGRVKVGLGETGSFSVVLPATDDVTLNPTGFGYTLVAKLNHTHLPAVSFPLPAADPVVDVTDVTEVDPSTFNPSATYSAYIVAVEQGFVGTEAEWLETLVGPAGPAGPAGAQGPAGASGASTWSAITGKPTTFKPDVTDADLAATIAKGRTSVLYAVDYGATTDGADSTAALQAAIDALPQAGDHRGGQVVMPSGVVTIAGSLNLNERHGVQLIGHSNMSRGDYGPSIIEFTGGGSGAHVTAHSAVGTTLKGIWFKGTNAAFSGKMFEFYDSVVLDSIFTVVDECTFSHASQTAVLWSLLHNVTARFTNCQFSGGDVALRGWSVPPVDSALPQGYSICITVDSCNFGNHASAAIMDPDYNWRIINSTFSPSSTGLANAIRNTAHKAVGLLIQGNYFGDASSGTYIEVMGEGAHIAGNYFDGEGVTCIFINRPSYGVVIAGNHIDGRVSGVGINFDPDTGASPSLGVVAIGNNFGTTPTPVVNHAATNMSVMLLANRGVADAFPVTTAFPKGGSFGPAGQGSSFSDQGDFTMEINRTASLSALKLRDYLLAGNTGAATTPGSVVRRMPVYDLNSNLLGYMPIYDTIT